MSGDPWLGQWCRLRFVGALLQLSKCAPSEAAKFGGGGVEFLGVVGAARLECGEPAAEPVGSMFQNSNSEIIVPIPTATLSRQAFL